MGHVVRDKYREPTSKALYAGTEKTPSGEWMGNEEFAYWVLGGAINSEFPGGATLGEVYHGVTGPRYGLSLVQTREMLQKGQRTGYIESVR